eukprot:GHVT01059356.1.p1 GENE.GHVT01059356.1~~GHVT01059356.1.p1  ORF type:complete len:117 (+),score=3.46 GHVT01059356.1:90-440(+)
MVCFVPSTKFLYTPVVHQFVVQQKFTFPQQQQVNYSRWESRLVDFSTLVMLICNAYLHCLFALQFVPAHNTMFATYFLANVFMFFFSSPMVLYTTPFAQEKIVMSNCPFAVKVVKC